MMAEIKQRIVVNIENVENIENIENIENSESFLLNANQQFSTFSIGPPRRLPSDAH